LNKRLLLLDLLLAALVIVLAVQVRGKWLEARKRSAAVLGLPLRQLPPPPYASLPAVQPVSAAAYIEVAQKDLFSADRNPDVVVEPPAEEPMPALPVLYGVMNLGDGTTAIMSTKEGAANRGIRLGEKVGPFTLIAINDEDVSLEWNGKTVTKKISELRPKAAAPAAAAAAEESPRKKLVAQAPGQAQPQPVGDLGPGRELTSKLRACQKGDSAPPGTERDGWRKATFNLPTGPGCHWVRIE
jgi:hypothetical protein